MAKSTKNYQIGVVAILFLLFTISQAQRPSFAGSRPTNGLNQKDKYHSTTPSNTDIQNRFGSADVPTISIQIPFGQTQKPPVGYPIVYPESVYTVLTSTSSSASSGNVNTGVSFEDRFGGDNSINSSPSSSSSSSSSSSLSTTQRTGVPLDAHGDQLLIDQLNRTPIDKRPFWFINYQAIEAQRNGTSTNFAGSQAPRGSFFG